MGINDLQKTNIDQKSLYRWFGRGNLIYRWYGSKHYSKYSFGNQTKYYDKSLERETLSRSGEHFLKLKGRYQGKRCFLIGNGPSLNLQKLTLLKDEFTIGSNYIFLNYDKMGFYPNILAVVNYLVAEQRADDLNNIKESMKVFPFFLRYCMELGDNVFFLNALTSCEFSTEIAEWISWRSTVTFFNMQIAYYLGFSQVYLIGVDHSYVQPEEGKEGAFIKSRGPDKNHFHGDYFGKGITWQKADTKRMEEVYTLAKEAFEIGGRKIYNATAGGKLEIFERVEYSSLFS